MIHYARKSSLKLAALLVLLKLLFVSTQSESCNSDQVFNSCCNGCGYFFTSPDEVNNAVDAFRFNSAAATNKYGIMNCWDVSKITVMKSIFWSELKSDGGTGDILNEPIQCWNVSSVTDMSFMFYGATSFNQPLENWNVSSVTDMEKMFYGATSFNQNLCQWYDNLNPQTVVLNMFSDTACPDKSDPTFVAEKSFCGACNTTVSFLDWIRRNLAFFSTYSLLIHEMNLTLPSTNRISARVIHSCITTVVKVAATNLILQTILKRLSKAWNQIQR
jgi:surface protein